MGCESVTGAARFGPDRGAYRSGGDGVDPDALRAELLGEGLAEVDQRSLGRRVVHQVGRGAACVDRADVDDVPVTLEDAR